MTTIDLCDDKGSCLFVFCESFDECEGPLLVEVPVKQVLIQIQKRVANLVQVINQYLNLSFPELENGF